MYVHKVICNEIRRFYIYYKLFIKDKEKILNCDINTCVDQSLNVIFNGKCNGNHGKIQYTYRFLCLQVDLTRTRS